MIFAQNHGHRRACSTSSTSLVRSHMPDRIECMGAGKATGDPVPAVLDDADMMRELLTWSKPAARWPREYSPDQSACLACQ